MADLATLLHDAGGPEAPRARRAQLLGALTAALDDGALELGKQRSGYPQPVTTAIALSDGGLVAVAPVDPALRADPEVAGERTWLLVAALVGALVDGGGDGDRLLAGRLGSHLALSVPAGVPDAELAALAFDEHIKAVDRLRARALAMPAHVLEDADDLKPPIGDGHPLHVAALLAELGANPADPQAADAHEEAILARQSAAGRGGDAVSRPHDDPEPARRVARRILQRLDGMGKWGGYHTAFDHLARGFAGNDRRLADAVGESLIAAGLLAEKPSVGQRHVYLEPRRAAEIRALIDDAALPEGFKLPGK